MGERVHLRREPFDAKKALRIAKRLALVEPDAAKQLFAAVELFCQAELEAADVRAVS
jgi:hypothetical protein